ncbi:MAG: hypothetical protein L0Z50_24305 [Verrucomicrobiales bacterium]|nr:hypothetical protein [Verrucomicrobiales bacterium]
MIQLHHDYLLFQTGAGEAIPCSAEQVTIELIGEYASVINPIILQQASAAVLHYFKQDLGREQVTIAEFSGALERVLKHFGFSINSEAEVSPSPIEAADLCALISGNEKAFELAFFPRLRAELQARLVLSPRVVAFNGLRGCVKQLLGVKRWSPRCQTLNDQIVEYLRNCLSLEERATSCGLVIR